MRGTAADKTKPQMAMDLLGELPGVHVSVRTIAEHLWGASGHGPWDDAPTKVKREVHRIPREQIDGTVACEIRHHYVLRGPEPVRPAHRLSRAAALARSRPEQASRAMQVQLPQDFFSAPTAGGNASMLLEGVCIATPTGPPSPVAFVAAADVNTFNDIGFVETVGQLCLAFDFSDAREYSGLWCVYMPKMGVSWHDARDFEADPKCTVFRANRYARLTRVGDHPTIDAVSDEPQPIQIILSASFLGDPERPAMARLDEIVQRTFDREAVVGYVEEGVDFTSAAVAVHTLYGGEKVDVYRSGRWAELQWVPQHVDRNHPLADESVAAFTSAMDEGEWTLPPANIGSTFSQVLRNAGARIKSVFFREMRLDVELDLLHVGDRVVSAKRPIAVLRQLAVNANQWVSASDLAKAVWGEHADVFIGDDKSRLAHEISVLRGIRVSELRPLADSIKKRKRKSYRRRPDDYMLEDAGAWHESMASAHERPFVVEHINVEAPGCRPVAPEDLRLLCLPSEFTTAADQPAPMDVVLGDFVREELAIRRVRASWFSHGNLEHLMHPATDESAFVLLLPDLGFPTSKGQSAVLHEIIALVKDTECRGEHLGFTAALCGEENRDSSATLWNVLINSWGFGWTQSDVVFGAVWTENDEESGDSVLTLFFRSNRFEGMVFASGRRLRVEIVDADVLGTTHEPELGAEAARPT